MRLVFQVQCVYRRERRTQAKCSCLFNNFVSSKVLEILFPSLNNSKNCKISLGLCYPQIRKLYL